jgi:hypothetical protein
MPTDKKPEELTEDEIAAANGEPLPDRQAMSVIREPLPQPIVPIYPGPGGVTIEPPPPEDV